jgi:hypothetical protein
MVAKQPMTWEIFLQSFITNHSHTCHGCKATIDMRILFTKLYHQSFPHLSWLQSNHWHEKSFYKALSPIIPTPVMVALQPWQACEKALQTHHQSFPQLSENLFTPLLQQNKIVLPHFSTQFPSLFGRGKYIYKPSLQEPDWLGLRFFPSLSSHTLSTLSSC